VTEEQINDAVMKAALLDAVMDALAGHEVSDFMESFVEVAAAQAARNTLECIAKGCAGPDWAAKGTLKLLGNYPESE